VTDLRLEARDFTDLTRWRWVLTDEDGTILAHHDVRLDATSTHFEAFTDLPRYLSWQPAPDRYAEDEARIIAETGDWIGGQVLGHAIMTALVHQRPATVRVSLPPEAEALAFRPLEMARAGGKPLAAHDITLVMEPASIDATGRPAPAGNRLRVLGLFSLPDGGQPLSLRRERHCLVQLIDGIAASGRAADVTVLQYGVTRASLRDALEDAAGWDIIHVSGHGAPGQLLLETAAGRPDLVTAGELADILATARGRTRLVTVAACMSGEVAATQRRLLRLPADEDQHQQTRSAERPVASPPDIPSAPPAIATELASRLGCAVLAMRYPVDDEFAIALSGKLYDLLIRRGQPLPRAIAMTWQHLANGAFPALSKAAPAIFGSTAAGLTLAAPRQGGKPSFREEDAKMAGFPPPPGRFVGRTGVMARASAALARDSRVPGVLLHGMPGGGKTACALELAYGHEDAFTGLIWVKAPDEVSESGERAEIGASLADFALKLEAAVDGLPMIDKLTDSTKLTGFLPVLTELMERTRLLIVIDNAESLLSDGGQWRHQRWGAVVGALTAHTGLGRVILTSRRIPAGARPGLSVEAVDALTADEALLLACELPHLRDLIYGEVPGIDRDTARKLALGVLSVAQGHPKLLELADGQAARPDQLTALIEAGSQTWQDPGDYLRVLAAWTKSVTDTLSPGERDLFRFLCCLEEPDRLRLVVDNNWAGLWQRLGRDGHPPGLDQALGGLAARGLITVREAADKVSESYAIHPGIAAAGHDDSGHGFQTAVDSGVGVFWHAVHEQASGDNDSGGVNTGLLVRAGLAAVPYLLRQEHWDDAARLLENAFLRNPSRASATVMLPAITRIADHSPRHQNILALILQALDPAAAETLFRACIDTAASRGDYVAASAAAARLAHLCGISGRLAEALILADTMAGYARQAGLGPWTQLAHQIQRLQILIDMDRAGEVLDDIQRLRRHMDTLPEQPGPREAIASWDVRERLLDTGRDAAVRLERWQDALDLSAQITASRHARRAPDIAIARARFDEYGPLLRLGRTDQALDLLLGCRQAFHETGDIRMLGKTLSALADTESQRGHGDAALRFARDALRYKYLAADIPGIAVSYHNLGGYLRDHARQSAVALASHLTAALIFVLTGIGGTDGPGSAGRSVRSAATDLRELGTSAEPPADIAELCGRLADIEGTDLPGLINTLSPDPGTAERTLQDLVARVRE
jgi:hypothetical protein